MKDQDPPSSTTPPKKSRGVKPGVHINAGKVVKKRMPSGHKVQAFDREGMHEKLVEAVRQDIAQAVLEEVAETDPVEAALESFHYKAAIEAPKLLEALTAIALDVNERTADRLKAIQLGMAYAVGQPEQKTTTTSKSMTMNFSDSHLDAVRFLNTKMTPSIDVEVKGSSKGGEEF